MIQIISISLQLSGAVILLLWCLKGAQREQIIRKYFPGSNIVKPDNDGNCILEKENLQNVARNTYLTSFAFFDLILGYLMAYFTTNICSPWVSVVITIIFSFLIILGEFYIAKNLAKHKYSHDEIVPYNELENYDVDSIVSDKEFDEFLADLYGKQ